MRRLWAFAALTSVVVIGCSALVDFNGLTGSALDAAASDASLVDGDITQSDAPPPIGDSASDFSDGTTLATDAGPTRFCPQDGAVLCSDFDEDLIDAAIPGEWGFVYAPGDAIVEVTNARFVSAPRSLHAQTDDSTTSAAVIKQSISVQTGVLLSFDVYIDALGSNANVASLDNGTAHLDLQPQSASTTILESEALSDGGTLYASNDGNTIPLGAWQHIDFDVDFTAKAATITLNGAILVHHSFSFSSAWAGTKGVNVSLGIGNSHDENVYFDNATIRTR